MNGITRTMIFFGWALVLMSAVAVVWTKQQSRNAFIELQGLQNTRDQLDIEWGQLQLEQSSWATHGRVEQNAHDTLKMIVPRPDEVRLVQ
jgi:cell division protein FtsL